MFAPNQSAPANRRPALRPVGLDNLAAIVAADLAFPAAVRWSLVVRLPERAPVFVGLEHVKGLGQQEHRGLSVDWQLQQ